MYGVNIRSKDFQLAFTPTAPLLAKNWRQGNTIYRGLVYTIYMQQSSWDEIEQIYSIPSVSKTTIAQFRHLKSTQAYHTKGEEALHHYCAFFLPYDVVARKIYLGHHKKADDWIPPGGHIEPGERPSDAAIREMKEELNIVITKKSLKPFNLSVKPINREAVGCLTHYDVWHLVDIQVQEFAYLKSEYYDARWFSLKDGVKKITKNQDFAEIIRQLI